MVVHAHKLFRVGKLVETRYFVHMAEKLPAGYPFFVNRKVYCAENCSEGLDTICIEKGGLYAK